MSPPSPLRIVYAAGPGDVIGTYRHWAAGRDDPAQVAVTYSAQFYDYCREAGASALVISSHRPWQRIAEGNLIIEHRPIPFQRAAAPLYHLGRIISGLRLTMSAIRFRASHAIVADGSHWFVLGLLPWFGVKVVPTLHCVLWPRHRPPKSWIDRMVWRLNRRFFRRGVGTVLSLSNDISDQVQSLLAGKSLRMIPFLPSYRPDSFGEGFDAPVPASPFRILFAGRIEKNKGVFDLLEIARRFASEGISDVEFDLCGDGSQLEALRQAALAAGLAERFRLQGHTARPMMMQFYERCHVVVVPTTSDFVEGFNKVVAEGVLAGRPVITSWVCPALEYVRDAVLEVPPDNARAYGEAILQLKRDPLLYQSKRLASKQVRKQFYDVNRGWKAALAEALQPG